MHRIKIALNIFMLLKGKSRLKVILYFTFSEDIKALY